MSLAHALDIERMPRFLVRGRTAVPHFRNIPFLKRRGFASYDYRGFTIRRNGREFILERAGIPTLFAESYPTLTAAMEQADWLARVT